MFALQRGRVVLDESVRIERVDEELRIEWNVGEVVGVLDTADEVLSVAAESAAATTDGACRPCAATPVASHGGHLVVLPANLRSCGW